MRGFNSKKNVEDCPDFSTRKHNRHNNDTTLFKVKLQTSPGDAIFEANVYAYNQTVVSIGNNIDRLNLYKGQSDCVQTANERLFCYCKNLLKEKGGGGTH
uniref:Uncharacterized protein n=1 Tax=Arion vulgaris TaxID=1028688 RepID=A0A0B7A4U3_9EUPU